MKFVHIADMHFDSPFTALNRIENLGMKRRLEQREVFSKVISYIKENEVPYFFISGDLYEHEYIRKSTIDYINQEFSKIPKTKIYIAPGNHDPYLKNSYYTKYTWNSNVHIFKAELERIETEDLIIYGYGFGDFYCKDCGLEKIKKEESNKLKVLVVHGSVDSGKQEDQEYNPMKKKVLEDLGFSYVALGHIHKNSIEENTKIVYPGSTISFGFDEEKQHGMVVGKIENGKLDAKLLPLDPREFIKRKVDVSEMFSKEELIEKIEEDEYNEKYFYELLLEGRRNFEIDTYKIYSLIENNNILKIKDLTKRGYDLEKLAEEENLKGIFANKMLEKLEKAASQEEKEMIEKAIEIGIDTLEG